eukprot:Skav212105  [mRNA]  locus=scaffold686:122915:145510:- [translate_table: standard]
MPALPVACREILAETIKVRADGAQDLHFESLFTLAAVRALMMLFLVLGIILFSLWRVADTAEPVGNPETVVSSGGSQSRAVAPRGPWRKRRSGPGLGRSRDEARNRRTVAEDGVATWWLGIRSMATGGFSSHGLVGWGYVAGDTFNMAVGETKRIELREQASHGKPQLAARSVSQDPKVALGLGHALLAPPEEPGKESGSQGRVLLSATSEMDLWKGPVHTGHSARRSQASAAPAGGSCLRQRFALQREDGETSVALSAGGDRSVELGWGSTRSLGVALKCTILTVKPDIDAVFALGCILLVLLFGDEAEAWLYKLERAAMNETRGKEGQRQRRVAVVGRTNEKRSRLCEACTEFVDDKYIARFNPGRIAQETRDAEKDAENAGDAQDEDADDGDDASDEDETENRTDFGPDREYLEHLYQPPLPPDVLDQQQEDRDPGRPTGSGVARCAMGLATANFGESACNGTMFGIPRHEFQRSEICMPRPATAAAG